MSPFGEHHFCCAWFMTLFYSELYEAERWHEDSRMWTPMTTLSNGQQIFIGDIIEYIDSSNCLSGKVTKFVKVCLILTTRLCHI